MGLSENRGHPQIAILMGNMVIIHWNMRYTIFRQTHIMYTQHTMLSILAAAHGGAGHGGTSHQGQALSQFNGTLGGASQVVGQ